MSPPGRHIFAIFIGLISWACVHDSSGYEALVAQWQGKEILLPTVMTDALTGDTIDLSAADFTILTYVDSAGCVGCRMKLPLWNEFFNSIDTITDAAVTMLMVVNPVDKNEVIYQLKHDNYNHPVYVDTADMVNTDNRFPDDASLRSFLIDRSRKVVATGNPLYHPNVAALYRSIISGEYSLSESFDSFVRVVGNSIDLGTVSVGQELTRHFKIINGGNDTVRIRAVIPSCHCSEADLPSDMILPKSHVDGAIKFRADSARATFHNSVHIFYEGFDYPSVVQIYGRIL